MKIMNKKSRWHLFSDSFAIRDSRFAIRSSAGFTLVELLISIAIIVILGAVTFGSFLNAKNSGDLSNTAKQIAALVRQAQTQSVQDYRGAAWGVRFANGAGSPSATFYAFFSGAYSTSTTTGYYRLPTTVAFTSSTLPASSSRDVIFSPISGFTTSTSIGLYLVGQPSMSSTILIATSGVVSY
jgi:prepilin-type N-terminal cleavage/methylation domain-containing protein